MTLAFVPTRLAFMSFGFSEILLVGVVALLVFGGNLPDVMRTLGRSYGKLRRSLHEISRPVRDEIRKVRDLPSVRDLGSMPATQEEYPDYEEPERGVSTEEMPPKPVVTPEADGATGAADEPPPV